MTEMRLAENRTGPDKDGAIVQLELGASNDKVRAYMMAVVDLLGDATEKIKVAVTGIASSTKCKGDDDILAKQLLAVRRYCRKAREKGVDLSAIWSWTEAEVPLHKRVEPTKTLYAEAAKVQAAFAQQNPGYQLIVTPVRSVERQVSLWAGNESVGQAGAQILDQARLYLADAEDEPTSDSALDFSRFLLRSTVDPEPTNAAPGLSDHGRGLAVDFTVVCGKTTVAGIKKKSIPKIWIGGGWFLKLKAAISGTRLRGPLPHPYEPWHWWLGT